MVKEAKSAASDDDGIGGSEEFVCEIKLRYFTEDGTQLKKNADRKALFMSGG